MTFLSFQTKHHISPRFKQNQILLDLTMRISWTSQSFCHTQRVKVLYGNLPCFRQKCKAFFLWRDGGGGEGEGWWFLGMKIAPDRWKSQDHFLGASILTIAVSFVYAKKVQRDVFKWVKSGSQNAERRALAEWTRIGWGVTWTLEMLWHDDSPRSSKIKPNFFFLKTLVIL